MTCACAVKISKYSTTLYLPLRFATTPTNSVGVRFGNYFGGAVGLLVDAVANNNGVGNADETVVDAIGVCVEDLRSSRSLYCASLVQVMTSTVAQQLGLAQHRSQAAEAGR